MTDYSLPIRFRLSWDHRLVLQVQRREMVMLGNWPEHRYFWSDAKVTDLSLVLPIPDEFRLRERLCFFSRTRLVLQRKSADEPTFYDAGLDDLNHFFKELSRDEYTHSRPAVLLG